MNCALVRRHVHAFVDAELDPATVVDFERHLESCEPCRDRVAFERAVKAHVRSALMPTPAPAALQYRIQASLDNDSWLAQFGLRPAWFGGRARYAVPAVAAAALLMVAFNTMQHRGVSSDGDEVTRQAATLPIFEDVVRIHSKSLPSEVKGPELGQVASWFRGKVEFPVRPMQFGEHGAELIGGRISNVRERTAATLYYNVHGHRVTVVVFVPQHPVYQGAQRFRFHNGRELFYRNVHGYVVPVVQHAGVTYALTGDLDPQTQLRLAARARLYY